MPNYDKIKQFWKTKINDMGGNDEIFVKHYFKTTGFENWENDLNNKKNLKEIQDYVANVYTTVYNKSAIFSKAPLGDGFTKFLGWLKLADEYEKLISDCMQDYEKELTALKTERNTLQSWKDSRSDYDAIKTQRDNLQTQITNLTQEKNNLQTERDRLKEQLGGKSDYAKIKEDITKQIINDSELELNKESNLEQLIAKIKQLVKNPDNVEGEISDLKREKSQLQAQITDKDKVIADLQKPNEEVIKELKQKIKESWKKMGISNSSLEKSLIEAQTYQQLLDLEQKSFATEQQKNKSSLQKVNESKNDLKTGLFVLLIIIALTLGGLGYIVLRKKRSKIN